MKQGDHFCSHAVCHVSTDEGAHGVGSASVSTEASQCSGMGMVAHARNPSTWGDRRTMP